MKFSVLQENLAKGLQIISKAIPAKSSLPILANVLIATENGRLKLSATNLDTAITTYIGASIDEEGSITIPAKLLKDFVSNLSPSTITAKLDNETLFLSSQKTKSKMNGISSKDYPELPTFPEKSDYLEIEPKVFSSAISLVAFASGADESRPIFTGIYLKYANQLLTFASTDGFRLSERTITLESAVPDFTAIIPAKTLMEVSRIFSSSTEPIKFMLNANENLALFKAEDTFITTRILDGQYPDYKRIIPVESTLKGSFASEDFSEAVKLTNIFAKEGTSTVKIRFDPQLGIRIASLAAESGEHESVIQAEIEGDLTEVAFSTKYVLDFLNNVKTERIIFFTNGNTAPCVLKSDALEGFLHIIMPMQL